MNEEEIELFEDILMCLKRISDFLSDKGRSESRKYIERFETRFKMIQDKKEKENKERQEDIIRIMKEQVKLTKKSIENNEKMRKVINEMPKATDYRFENKNECPYKKGG